VLDAEPGIVATRSIRAAQLQQHNVDDELAGRDQPRQVGNIRRDHVVGPAGKESPAGAGAAERGHRHLGMTGAERIAEGQREEHPERRTARGLRVEQAGEENRLGGRLGPADRLAGADQLGEIERLGRELTRQTGDTEASQSGFRRRCERSTDLCGKDQRSGVSDTSLDTLWVRLSRSWHPANGRYRRILPVPARRRGSANLTDTGRSAYAAGTALDAP
jgi:hypothetical protein